MHPFPKVIAFMVFFAARATWSAFDVDAPDSASARVNYGIYAFSNPSSTTSLKVQGGVITWAMTLASDSTEGYTANVGLQVPLCPDGRRHDLKEFQGLEFQYRNSNQITDYFGVHFQSDVDTATSSYWGSFYEGLISGTTLLAASNGWKTIFLEKYDFASTIWDFVGGDDLVDLDSMLSMVTGIEFTPKTRYANSGTQNGTACTKCVGPTMTRQTLEIRNIAIYDKESTRIELQNCTDVAVAPRLSRASFEASYRDGVLSVERKLGSSTVDVVSASGRRVASFAPHETRKYLALERGTWFLVERSSGKAPLTRSLAIVR